ncbi:transcription factor IBH1-like [Ziziphus jujuba]|uniref:Transcription factor IBH1-like n=1 Tax=Ziziphus jujuba TaxID=326968 RepID=A0ABM4A3K5_ZIZJJ|nr:transcription factor IBH1-like [Ziziphus jujuba]
MDKTSKGIQTLSTHCSYKTKFAFRFLRSLMKLKKQHQPISSSSSSSMELIHKRSQRIKMLAYSSIAHAAGPRRAWSRAILFKLQSRARHHYFTRKRSSLDSKTKQKKILKNKRVMRNHNIIRAGSTSRVTRETKQMKKLREIVPGGKEMDICSLFDETAHYVKCLSMQVQVMQAIADRFSK